MISLFWKNAYLPPKWAKRSKSGRGSWTKSTFLYIAQNCLIRFFLIFCIKLEGIKGYKLPQMPISGKFSFCRFRPFLLIFGPKINFFVYCWKLAHYIFLIFCMKFKGIKGYKLPQMPFFSKILIFTKNGKKGKKNGQKWSKMGFLDFCAKLSYKILLEMT